MATFVQSGSVIELTPDPTWAWFGWDGCLKLTTGQVRALFRNDGFIVRSDFVRLESQIEGKAYVAKLFEDTPGTAGTVAVRVNERSLSDRMMIDGEKAATSETTGTFTIDVHLPSIRAGAPPVKDPIVKHFGTWTIRRPEGNRTSSP